MRELEEVEREVTTEQLVGMALARRGTTRLVRTSERPSLPCEDLVEVASGQDALGPRIELLDGGCLDVSA